VRFETRTAWEAEAIASTRQMQEVLHAKGVPATFELLGSRRGASLVLVAEDAAPPPAAALSLREPPAPTPRTIG
jgi:hypothetical protein